MSNIIYRKSKSFVPLKLLFLLMLLMQVIPKVLLFHDTAADIFKLESLLVADVEHVLLYFRNYKYTYEKGMYGD
jgi:hypothetical protein